MKVEVLGVKIDALRKSEVMTQISGRLQRGEQTFIVTPYSESLVAAQKDTEYREVLNSADFVLPDGVGVLWAAHFLKRLATGDERSGLSKFGLLVGTLVSVIFRPDALHDPIPEKISGADFVWDLIELAAKQDKFIYLLGGFGDTTKKAAEKLRQSIPNLKIVGADSGDGGEGTVEKVNQSGADILLVALGARKQEQWIYANRSKLAPRVLIGLGGTFDYLAGKRPYRPLFWASRGLEWLWRLVTQPWRVGRILRGVFGLIYYSFKYHTRSL